MKHTQKLLMTLPILFTTLTGCDFDHEAIQAYCPTKQDEKYTVGDFEYAFSDPQKTNLMAIRYLGTDTEITIPDKVAVSENGIAYPVKALSCGIFYQNKDITAVHLPETMTVIGDSTFQDCKNLTEINLPSSLSVIGESAFSHCTSLSYLNFEDGISVIGSEAFSHCDAIKTATFQGLIDVLGESAFYECGALTDVGFLKGISVLGDNAFYQCKSLVNLTFGKGTDVIGDNAFAECTSLNNISYLDTAREWKSVVKGKDWCQNAATSTVHCTDKDATI